VEKSHCVCYNLRNKSLNIFNFIIMIDDLRGQIDVLDKKILSLLKERFVIAQQIGDLKKGNDLPVVDEDREALILKKLAEVSIKEGLNPDFVCSVYELIFKESRRLQC